MKNIKIGAIASSLLLSIVVSGCGSDGNTTTSSNKNSDNTTNTGSTGNTGNTGNTNLPDTIKLTDKNNWETYNYDYNLSGNPTSDTDYLVQNKLIAKKGKVSIQSIPVFGQELNQNGNGGIDVFADHFQSKTFTGKDSILGSDADYLVFQNRNSDKQIFIKRTLKAFDLAGQDVTQIQYETPLTLYSDFLTGVKFPQGAKCWLPTTQTSSESLYMTDLSEVSSYTSVNDWVNDPETKNVLTASYTTSLVGTNNQYTAYTRQYKAGVADSGTSNSTAIALIEKDGKYYDALYIIGNKEIEEPQVECEFYNQVAVNFINKEMKKMYKSK